MKVYCAAKFEEKTKVREVFKTLEAAGHTPTHDWTHEDLGDRTGQVAEAYLAQCGIDDVLGVQRADAVILFHHPQLYGGMVELGMAIALDKLVILVKGEGGRDTPFFHLPCIHHATSLQEALAILAEAEM